MPVRRFDRIFSEGREDVGEKQLLVLLLVIGTEFEELECRRRKRWHRPQERFIDMRPICPHFLKRWPAKQAPARTRMALSFRFIIAVEQEGIAFVEQRIATHVIAQHERLEEPCRMSEMPLGRRGIGKRLNGCVGIAERRGEIERQPAGREQSRREVLGWLGASMGCHCGALYLKSNLKSPDLRTVSRPVSTICRRPRARRRSAPQRTKGPTGGLRKQ